MIAAGTATLVGRFNLADVEPVKNIVYNTYGMVGGNKFAQ